MMASMLAVTNPGHKVILFSPFYDNHIADLLLNGAEPIFVNLYPPRFHFDAAELRAAFEQGARALILGNLSNPTGRVFSLEELQVIAGFAREFDA